MDINEVARRDGKARSAFNVNEKHTYIHTEYEIVLDSGQVQPTGLLVIVRLKPKNATIKGLPEFILRWDEKASWLDVQPVNVPKDDERKFKNGISGYYGHHSKKVASGPRVFEVNVGWRGQSVYHGEISFSLGREVEAKLKIGLRASASVGFIKGNG